MNVEDFIISSYDLNYRLNSKILILTTTIGKFEPMIRPIITYIRKNR